MKQILSNILLTLLLVGGSLPAAISQGDKAADLPEFGKPIPEYYFSKITHHTTTKGSLNDFKGKWLFLDFWFSGCTACIKAFPKVNEFQQQFQDQILFVLVGLNNDESGKGIEQLYEKLREKWGLNLVVAYDSLFVEKWNIHSMPHIIIIDPAGIIRAITDGRDMNAQKIIDLLAGKNVSFFPKGLEATKFELPIPDPELLYRSVLCKWNGEEQIAYIKISDWYYSDQKKEGFKVSGLPLLWLYYYAYLGQQEWSSRTDSMYGKVYPFPVLELGDSSLFEVDPKMVAREGFYNYNLVLPESTSSVTHIMKTMQQELKNIFGYEVVLENRPMPIWTLTAEANAGKKLKTKGGKFTWSGAGGGNAYATGFEIRNTSISILGNFIMRYIGYNEPPLFDETGITGNIDINIDADMTNIEDIKKALQAKGLNLSKREKEMKVLVIRDSRN